LTFNLQVQVLQSAIISELIISIILQSQGHRKVCIDSINISIRDPAYNNSLNGAECRKWWQVSSDTHTTKASMRRAQVEWAIKMLVFCIGDYEGFLRTIIETYDRFSRTSTFSYLGRAVVVSYKAADFTSLWHTEITPDKD
jgi:hypothetical protein